MFRPKKYGAPLLCLLGLWLALVIAAKPPANKSGWPDGLPYTAGGFILALVGAGIWRRQSSAQLAIADTHIKNNPEFDDCDLLWDAFLEALQVLQAALPTLTLAEISVRLLYLQDHFILPLSQARMAFFVGSDRERGLERLTAFSRGELWINRAQSTAGDQHRQETLAAFEWAVESFLMVQNSFSGK